MTLRIAGLATALPDHAIDQQTAAGQAARYAGTHNGDRRQLQRFYERSTVRQRYSVVLSDADGDARGDRPAPTETNASSRAGAGDSDEPPRSGLDAFYPEPADATDAGPTVRQRMTAYRRHAGPLAQAAASGALRRASVEPAEVRQIITVSCTGFSAPGLDVQLIDALGLPSDTGRTMIGFMGCHGALNGLRVAMGLAAEPGGWILLCPIELCSLHFQYGRRPDQLLANALFADGAAAMLLRRATDHPGPNATHASLDSPDSTSQGESTFPDVVDCRSKLLPDSREDMQWHIAEHGFEMTLSRRVPGLIESHLRPWLADWLGEHGLGIRDVAGWAIHPGGPQIISAVETALALPAGAGDVSREVLADYGNMSSPTLLFILDRLRASSVPAPWVALGFGPGLVVEAALLR